MSAKKKAKPSSPMATVIKAILIATAVTIALIVVYALLLYGNVLDAGSMTVITVVLKVICAVAAAFLTVRKITDKRWLWGGIAGALYIVTAFLVFSALSESFCLGTGFLTDLGMGTLAGVLTALLVGILGK